MLFLVEECLPIFSKWEKNWIKAKRFWRVKGGRRRWENFGRTSGWWSLSKKKRRRVKTLKEVRVTRKSKSRRWSRDRDRRWWGCRRRDSTLTMCNRASRSEWSGSGWGRQRHRMCEGASFDGVNLYPAGLPRRRRRRRKRRFDDRRTRGRRRRVILSKDNASGLLLQRDFL